MRITSFIITGAMFAFALTASARDLPEGFTEEVLEQVLQGQIVHELKTENTDVYHGVRRAYFKNVSTDAFIALAVNHVKYADLFEEVDDARTLTVNSDRTEFTYGMDLKIKVGFLTFFLNGKGKQTVRYASETLGEASIANELTNYKDKVSRLTQDTRLIPYEDGILVEEAVHLVMQPNTSSKEVIKDYLKNFFSRYVATFRAELEG